jgi:hypothetical protein
MNSAASSTNRKIALHCKALLKHASSLQLLKLAVESTPASTIPSIVHRRPLLTVAPPPLSGRHKWMTPKSVCLYIVNVLVPVRPSRGGAWQN